MPYRYSRRVEGLQSSAIREILQVVNRGDVISFAGGLPAAELFPVGRMAELAAEIFAGPDAQQALQYGETEGHGGLRERIAARLPAGHPWNPSTILVTQGSQQGIDLLSKLFLDPGDEVLVESPAYLGALQVFRFFGAKVTFLPTDDEGVLPDALAEALTRNPKLLYLTPTFQNPSGLCYSERRRQELRAVIADSDILVIEDDPYRDLWYDEEPPAPLSYGLDPARTVYLGSFSKTSTPGLRVGYLASNEHIFRRAVQVKQATDLQTNSLGQHLLFRLLGDPQFDAHVANLRRVYGARRDVFLHALDESLTEVMEWRRPGGGMFVWARLRNGGSASDLLRHALDQGLAFVSGAEFHAAGEGRDTLRLNFTHSGEARLREGVARLARAALPTA